MSTLESIPPPIVIDNGSGTIKAGFSGDKLPKVIIPSIIGNNINDEKSTTYYCGNDAQSNQTNLRIKYPLAWKLLEMKK